MAMNKNEFLAKCSRRYIEVKGVRMQSLTAKEFFEWEADRIDYAKGKVTKERIVSARTKLLSLMIVDDEGNRMFPNHRELEDLDSNWIGELYDAAMAHAGFADQEDKSEDTEKN
jgi:hypothetical protein